MALKFEELPTRTRNPEGADPKEREYAEELKQNPDQWAVIFEFETNPEGRSRANALAQAIRLGSRAAFGKGFESATRTREGKVKLYARYTGDS